MPPAAGGQNGNGEAVFPASAFRVTGSSTVRLTESDRPVRPARPATPGGQSGRAADLRRRRAPAPSPCRRLHEPVARTGSWSSINHRPRRLGGPAAAVGAVARPGRRPDRHGARTRTPPAHHAKSPGAVTTTAPVPITTRPAVTTTTTTTTTAPLTVSAPASPTAAHGDLSRWPTPASRCHWRPRPGSAGSTSRTRRRARCSSPGRSSRASRTRIAATGPVTVIRARRRRSRPPSTARRSPCRPAFRRRSRSQLP